MFANWFVRPLVVGYVWYWVCLFAGCWLCDSIISLTLGMVSVLEFFITDLHQSHDFKLQMGRLLAIFGVHLSNFFYVAFCCYVYYHGLFVSYLGWCGCWPLCVVISISTELLCFVRGI